jgi:hypothetical protein
LLLYALDERSRADPPFCVRIASPSAGAGAGRIDHDEVRPAVELGDHVGITPRRPHLNVARTRPRDAFVNRYELALVDVGCVNLTAVFHDGCQRQRLAAGAGREIDNLFAGLGAGEQRRKLGALVLNLDLAFAERRLGVDRRVLGIGGEPNAQP